MKNIKLQNQNSLKQKKIDRLISTLLAQVGCIMLVLAGIFIYWYPRHKKCRASTVAFDIPMMQVLQCELEKIEIQINLARSALWWHLPLIIGIMIFIMASKVHCH